jgi:pyrimidine operon attenuation protein / uracil phosphoribosyltransferase
MCRPMFLCACVVHKPQGSVTTKKIPFKTSSLLFLHKISSLKVILTEPQLAITIKRLAHQALENNINLDNTVLIGLQPRGIFLSDRIVAEIKKELPPDKVQYGKLDITFYRDDVRKELHIANRTDIPFSIEGKKVILIDDVLYTGRTIRAALDALLDFGRPEKVELCVLIDRRYSRQFPIQPDYTGKSIDSIISQKVKVFWKEKDGKDEVAIVD